MKRYKRFQINKYEEEIQEFLNELTTEGWDIMFYNEERIGGSSTIRVVTVCSKTFS